MLIEIIKLFFLRQKLKKLKQQINKLLIINNKLIEKNSKLILELNILKKPFEDNGDLTWSAYKLLLNKS